MPETYLRLRWPDAREAAYYSPSTIIGDHFDPDASYNIDEFVARARMALRLASDRVRTKYGFACARAGASLAEIERTAANFAGQEQALVKILGVGP